MTEALRHARYVLGENPVTAFAFDPRLQTGLKPIFGSDIGHFDVINMSDPVEEAWELVERGLMTAGDFRQFTFSNAVALHRAWG